MPPLPRQLKALLEVLLRGIQIVPFVEYAAHAKIRFVGTQRGRITKQLQITPKGIQGARLGIYLVIIESQRSPVGGNLPNQSAGLVVRLGALQGDS